MVKFHLPEYKPTHSLSDFEFLHDPKDKRSKLGLGSFATVKLAREKKSGKLFALKLIDISPSKATKSDLSNLKSEILIHKDLNHPHVIKFHGYMQEENTVYLILDYAENGNLYSYHHRKKALTEKEIFRFFHQACLAINYLHENDIVHRDIKPENLLLDKDFNIKICDFGWSAYNIRQERNTFCGTYEYMAPELVNKETYDHRVDIWAIGVLLYELIHNKAPYKGRTMQEIKASLSDGEIVYNSEISADAKNLIQKILKNDPKHRTVISDILSDSWVAHHLEREEVFRKTVYQDDAKYECSKNQQKLRIFDSKEEVKKKPDTILASSAQQSFNIPAYLKKGISVTSSSSTANRSRPDEISPINFNATMVSNFANEKQSPKSAIFSSTRISDGPKTPPKVIYLKKIFDDAAVISPSFNDRFNRVISNLNNNNNNSNYSILNVTKTRREGISSPASYRVPDCKLKADIYGSSGVIEEGTNNKQNKKYCSREVKSFILDELHTTSLNNIHEENFEDRSLRNLPNLQRQEQNKQIKLQENPFLATKEPHIIRVEKKNQIPSKNNENQKLMSETARLRIFNDELKRKMVSKLLEDFSFVKSLLSGQSRVANYSKENSTVVKIGQRNL